MSENDMLVSVVTNGNEPPAHFDSFDKLPEDLAYTAMQITAFAAHYVHPQSKSFDWDGFARAATEYEGEDLMGLPINTNGAPGVTHCHISGSDVDVVEIMRDDHATDIPETSRVTAILLGGYLPPQRGPREISFDSVLGWMVDTLTDTLGINIPKGEIVAPLKTVFKDLAWSQSDGVMSGTNTSWEYRTVYKYAVDGSSDKFHCMVTSTILSMDVSKMATMWSGPLTQSHFIGRIKAAKLEVTKGFEYPMH
ncbi:hypothetical protein OE88DRAFT_1739734 [Heliocybe sulcata]|uniref:Uncharacterized protein n=1 Tax=Heliocybe sulcata TaxID=5364 RepID=A0A5C3MMV9_9AGAM|nr:hypothetical protein OE88DRAFT_1739734 [Heliocybe sulcata]